MTNSLFDLHGLGPSPRAAPTAALELLDVIADFGLVSPLLDLLFGDFVLSHENIAPASSTPVLTSVNDAEGERHL